MSVHSVPKLGLSEEIPRVVFYSPETNRVTPQKYTRIFIIILLYILGMN